VFGFACQALLFPILTPCQSYNLDVPLTGTGLICNIQCIEEVDARKVAGNFQQDFLCRKPVVYRIIYKNKDQSDAEKKRTKGNEKTDRKQEHSVAP
jgi:hypothetical protein